MTAIEHDRFDARRALRAGALLEEFNAAGVLAAADVHVAHRLAALAREDDPEVALAAALAVRAPRLGHVLADLATIRETVAVDADEPIDLSHLPWPDPDRWLERCAASRLVSVGEAEGGESRPLRLSGTRLYLDRYWREERAVADDLRAFAASEAGGVDLTVLRDGLDRLFHGDDATPRLFAAGDGSDRQRVAAATAVLRRLTVVAGGPGTGKTTTVARIVALLAEQAAATGAPPPLVALAAPTGKAAARLEEAVREEAARLPVADSVREALLGLGAFTLHRLLGRRPGSHSRFRHDRGNRLPHDVVVVDETSMVSLSLMARLVEAVRAEARLILVGDPGQLTSIEAGAVLGDIVGPAAGALRLSPSALERLEAACGPLPEAAPAPPGDASVRDGTVVLTRVHRFGGAIAELAAAIRTGDADAAVAVLARGTDDVRWIAVDSADPGAADALAPVRDDALAAGRAVIAAAAGGDAPAALRALAAHRLLCAHRRGPYGVATWQARLESWLAVERPDIAAGTRWYVGRPLLVTENDYGLRLFNGDTGVVVTGPTGRPAAVFERGGQVVSFSPTRLGAVDTVHAMTVHKSQGSQFATVAVLLPDAASPLLTRELLYTAVTRARTRLVVVGTEQSVRGAVERPVARSSGLGERLALERSGEAGAAGG